MIVTSAVVGISYIVVITYCLRYLIASFTTRLPWVGCDNDWNTKFCSSKFVDCKSDGLVFLANGTCVSPDILTVSERIDYGVVTLPFGNYSVGNITDPLATERVRPSEEYWKWVLNVLNVRVRTSMICEFLLVHLHEWYIAYSRFRTRVRINGLRRIYTYISFGEMRLNVHPVILTATTTTPLNSSCRSTRILILISII